MIDQNIELHNVIELKPAAGGGVHLRHIPQAVRDCLRPLGRRLALASCGCELRFVTDAESIRVAVPSMPSTLAPWEFHNQDVFIFKGAFFRSLVRMEPGKVNHLNLTDIGGGVKNAFLGLKPEVSSATPLHRSPARSMAGGGSAWLGKIGCQGRERGAGLIRGAKTEGVFGAKSLAIEAKKNGGTGEA